MAAFVTLIAAAYMGNHDEGYWMSGTIEPQPILFSHRHHSGELGIDCRYCHTTVEKSAFAGMPSTETCLSCHRGLFRDSPMLEPLWESLEAGQPIAWERVHDLKDVVYFDHQVHVTAGVSCRQCHGDVEDMVTVQQVFPLTMQWCLECHRAPDEEVRREWATINVRRAADPRPTPPTDPAQRAHPPFGSEAFNTANLTDCTACHR